jgi:hypothetical protein
MMWLQKVEEDKERHRRAVKRLREMYSNEEETKRAKRSKLLSSHPPQYPKKGQRLLTPREFIKKKLAQKI